MNTPQTVSYQMLLAYLEDRLWSDGDPDDYAYLVELVEDLYQKAMQTEIGTLHGCLQAGPANRELEI